jgi:hypothetical protein
MKVSFLFRDIRIPTLEAGYKISVKVSISFPDPLSLKLNNGVSTCHLQPHSTDRAMPEFEQLSHADRYWNQNHCYARTFCTHAYVLYQQVRKSDQIVRLVTAKHRIEERQKKLFCGCPSECHYSHAKRGSSRRRGYCCYFTITVLIFAVHPCHLFP